MVKVKPTVEKVPVNGISLFCRDWGRRGPDMLLLHGATGYGGAWGPLAEAYGHAYHCVAPDLRGHGDSDKPAQGYSVHDYSADIVGLVRRLGLSDIVLVGSSLGGNTAMAVAAEQPDLVRRLVLIDPACAIPADVYPARLKALRETPTLYASVHEAIEQQRRLPGRGRWDERFLAEYVTGNLRRRSDGRYEWKWRREAVEQTWEGFKEDFWPLAAQVRCPTLLLHGVESDLLTYDDAVRLARAIRRCDLIHMGEAGHSLYFENTRSTLSAIWMFLDGP